MAYAVESYVADRDVWSIIVLTDSERRASECAERYHGSGLRVVEVSMNEEAQIGCCPYAVVPISEPPVRFRHSVEAEIFAKRLLNKA